LETREWMMSLPVGCIKSAWLQRLEDVIPPDDREIVITAAVRAPAPSPALPPLCQQHYTALASSLAPDRAM